MMTCLGSSRDGAAVLAGLELGRACALVLPDSLGEADLGRQYRQVGQIPGGLE